MRESVEPPVRVGAVIGGKYRIDEFVGSGAMSVVALAFHLELEQEVAIKFLHAIGVDHEQSALRFKREARAAAKIQSEHVTRVLDVGTLPEGCPYIVMEHLRGNDLARELATRGPLAASEVAGYMLAACEALAEAHAAGIVHRDIKPENLFLAERADGSRTVKVLDFGISKSMSQSLAELSLTGTASFMGSPLYMSPEQMRSSRNVDARTDIWSIGTVIYEMVSGAIPFSAESIPELCLAVIGNEPKSLRELCPDLPAGFEEVVARCLEKDRERRYATVAELARALGPFTPAGQSSAERTGRILALSGTSAERLAAVDREARSRKATESVVPPTVASVAAPAMARSGGVSAGMRKVFSARNTRAVIAGCLGLALGALWMSRSSGSGSERPASATAELTGPPPLTEHAAPRVEPVERLVEVAPSVGLRDAERSELAVSVAPRVTAAARPRAARATLAAGGSVASAPSAVPVKPMVSPEGATKRVDAWDPSTFGGRY